MAPQHGTDPRLARGIEALPALRQLQEAAGESPLYLVGGAVRDILLGRPRDDVDVVVEGDAPMLAERLGGESVAHERFATAVVELDGMRIDLASARAETYTAPGALPNVSPASLADDLARRDFTVNAMAVRLGEEPRLIDPYGGEADLQNALLRVLHPRSFVDDPTRALRAARYAARLGFAPEAETEQLLRAADLSTVSQDRVDAELRRIAAEPEASRSLELAAGWGLVELAKEAAGLIGRIDDVLGAPGWKDVADRRDVILAALEGVSESVRGLATSRPARPSEAVALAQGRAGVELALARASGAEWLDRYVNEWAGIQLEIDGADLLEAGVPEGPAIGRGLGAALARKLDGELSGRDAELAAAIEAARETT